MAELLAPAGDLERFKIAIEYGADAVYLGGKQFSLRARASNFSEEDIKEAVEYAHLRNRKVYVTVNMIPHNEDFDGLSEYLTRLQEIGVDAIICASRAILSLCKKVAPKMEAHVSTQQTTVNSKAIEYWQKIGADRIVLGREVTYDQLQQIMGKTTLPVEVFIHGGMCANYSGRCTISNALTNRDANRGGCAQSCRWNYHLYHNDQCLDNGEYLLSMGSKDMCAAEYLERILKTGVASLKIEGRMKTAYYIANVVKGYRQMIDAFNKDGYISSEVYNKSVNLIRRSANRETFCGFYPGVPGIEGQLYNTPVQVMQNYVASVIDYNDGVVTVENRNKFAKGDILYAFNPKGDEVEFVLERMTDIDGNEVEIANKPMQLLKFEIPVEVDQFSFIVKK